MYYLQINGTFAPDYHNAATLTFAHACATLAKVGGNAGFTYSITPDAGGKLWLVTRDTAR